ncbi:MAG TPA: metalloregulator ArsR/SmtB family transcription factor [Thermoanaerobaculia bacterium]|nr:metalloregulator ArsR/SmtB family transcription factor [Thermoanaerobaculia bacterium]
MTDRDLSLDSFFQALADRTRLRLLHLMRGGEVCVCFFVEVLGEPQPKISRHLGHLRKAGLVTARRDGKWIHYGLAPIDDPYRHLLEAALDAAADVREMQRDRMVLERACCATRLPVSLRNAPRPTLVFGTTN